MVCLAHTVCDVSTILLVSIMYELMYVRTYVCMYVCTILYICTLCMYVLMYCTVCNCVPNLCLCALTCAGLPYNLKAAVCNLARVLFVQERVMMR